MTELAKLFQAFADNYGLPWALLLALAVAYWKEIQDRKKNTVPIELYDKTVERVNKILDNQVSLAGAQTQLTELVKLALTGKGR